jgi:hypothetical protein
MRYHTRLVYALDPLLESTQQNGVETTLTTLKAFLQKLDSALTVADALLESMLPSIQTDPIHTYMFRSISSPYLLRVRHVTRRTSARRGALSATKTK